MCWSILRKKPQQCSQAQSDGNSRKYHVEYHQYVRSHVKFYLHLLIAMLIGLLKGYVNNPESGDWNQFRFAGDGPISMKY